MAVHDAVAAVADGELADVARDAVLVDQLEDAERQRLGEHRGLDVHVAAEEQAQIGVELEQALVEELAEFLRQRHEPLEGGAQEDLLLGRHRGFRDEATARDPTA